MKRTLLAALLVVAALALVACGGDDDDGGDNGDGAVTEVTEVTEEEAREQVPSGPPQDRDEYLDRTSNICIEHQQRINQQFAQLESEEQLEEFIDDVMVPEAGSMLAKLRALEPPEGDEEQVAEIYDALEAAIEQVRDEGLELGDNPTERADRLALDYGMVGCAGEPEPGAGDPGAAPGQGEGQ